MLSKLGKIGVVLTLLLSPFNNVVQAVTTDANVNVSTQFIPYENSEGQMIYDPTNEPGISPDEVDFTSGSNSRNTVGDKPSFYVYGDSTNLYFRMRLLGDPFDRKGGFLSSVWNVDILVDGIHKATVGIDGKSPQLDYVFVASPDKSKVIEVSKTDSTGSAVPGTSISDAENGHYFLDLKVPISKIKEIIPDLDESKPNVSFGFSTSKSANLRVVNKDGLEAANQGASVKLSPFGIYKPTIQFDSIMTFNNPNPIIKGITTNAANGSTVTLVANNKTYTGSVTDGGWNIQTDLPTGTYEATATVKNEEDNKATSKSTIQIGKEISIDGPAVERLYEFPKVITGKFVNSSGGNKQVIFKVNQVVDNKIINKIDLTNQSTGGLWTFNTSVSGIGEYRLEATEKLTGNQISTSIAHKTIYVIPPPTITNPVVEDGKLVVKGTGEKGETVELWVDGVLYKSVKADETTGEWSTTVDLQLSVGSHTFQAKAYDDYLSVGQSIPVTYQTSNITVSIANGDSTVSNDSTPTIYGKTSASNNGKVEVKIDGGAPLIASVTNGKWRLPLQTALSEGTHIITATAIDGNLVSPSVTQELILDLTTSVTLAHPNEFKKENNTFTGTGEALGNVIIQVDNGPQKIINLKDLGLDNTQWSFETGELAYGNHTITVSGMDELGNTNQTNGTEAKVTYEFTIVDPTKPIATDEHTYTIKNQAKINKLIVADQNIESLQYTIKSNGEKGTATIDSTGNWTYQPYPNQLGEDTFVVLVKNKLGNTTEATITIQILELDVDINGLPDLRTDDLSPSFTGTAKKTLNSVLTVLLLKEDGTEVTQAEVSMNENGDWQFDTPTLEIGKYILKAVIKDTKLGTEAVDTKSFTVYKASYNITLLATPEKVIADGVSQVTLKALVTDQDMKPVANERVTFTTEQGELDQTEAVTDAYGLATVQLTTPDYFGTSKDQSVNATATVNNVEKNLYKEAVFTLTFVPAFVKGKVLDAMTEKPISGATIRVNKTYDDGKVFTYEGTTDAEGNYVFPVKRGNTAYEVEISVETTVEGRKVPITFTQHANVDLGMETDIEKEAERTVSGQVFVVNKITGTLENITSALGDVTLVPEIENPTEDMQIVPSVSGQFKVTGGEIGKKYNVRFTLQHNGVTFAGKTVEIKIPEDGQATILPILIDPYGTVADNKTNEGIEGAEVTLYWANTEKNKQAGRVAHTKVELPLLEGFVPNNNQNSQMTTSTGSYAWMVFPEGDYYIVAKKEGYYNYSSLEEGRNVLAKKGEDSYVENGIIHVGYSIVNYDIKMEQLPEQGTEVKNEAPMVTDDEVTTLKHTKVDGTVQANDGEQDPLSYAIGKDGQNGKATVTVEGQWTYNPNTDFVGDDRFTVLVNDGHNEDVEMTVVVHVVKSNLSIAIDGGEKQTVVDRTPVLTGETNEAVEGKVTVVIKDKDGQQVETATVNVVSGKWSYQVQKELSPEDYEVEANLTDAFYNESVNDDQTLTIAHIPLQIELIATPSSIVGDGKTEVTLTAVIKNTFGEPIVNETVYFETELGDLKTSEAKTNEKGEAAVILVAPDLTGNLQTIVKKVTASVHNPDQGLVDSKAVSITFVPAKVTGQVIDSITKKPVPNAIINIKEDFNKDGVIDFQTTVKTNENGEYDIVVPKGAWNYKLQITTTMTVEGVEVPVTFIQDANVGETSGVGEELKSEHAVIGQLFMKNEETGKPESITSMVPGATFDMKPIGATTSDVQVSITPTGQYIITGGEKGESYTFAMTVIVKDKDGNDVILAGQKMTVTIPEDGVASIESTLIDPYGIVRDPDSLEPIEGVDMQLYWADTETNRKHNRVPNTLVELPILENFAPNQNRNNQYTTSDGQYAWMVFADGDYYIIAKKDGYPVYDSRIEGRTVEALPGEDSYITNGIIHVGQTIVEYNMNMFSKLTEPIEETPPVVENPPIVENEPTPVAEESKPVVVEAQTPQETPVKESASPVTNLPIAELPKTGSPFTTWTLLMLGTVLLVLGLVIKGRRKES